MNCLESTKRHEDPVKHYTKEAKTFMVGKLIWQFCDHGHGPIVNAIEGSKFWNMTLDLLCEETLGSGIDWLPQEGGCKWTL